MKYPSNRYYYYDPSGLSIEPKMPAKWDQYCKQVRKDEGDIGILKISVSKWKYIAKLLLKDIEVRRDGGRFTCALCECYCPNNCYNRNCDGCPIYATTGVKFCEDTPYTEWEEKSWDDGTTIEQLYEIAEEEVSFLKAILKDYREELKHGGNT